VPVLRHELAVPRVEFKFEWSDWLFGRLKDMTLAASRQPWVW
jgi:hypothetical protein